jgi:hypothetical protein
LFEFATQIYALIKYKNKPMQLLLSLSLSLSLFIFFSGGENPLLVFPGGVASPYFGV